MQEIFVYMIIALSAFSLFKILFGKVRKGGKCSSGCSNCRHRCSREISGKI